MATGNRSASSRGRISAVPGWESWTPGIGARAQALRTLSPEECLDLLGPGGIGRVGFISAGRIMMLPVNFAVTLKTIIFRTAPDTLLALHADAPVSFEADHLDDARHEGWSVLVHGHAQQVTDERAVMRLEDQLNLEPWAPGARDVYVRIVPTQITGRRIQPR
jgi:nitroimidazol reductase NimA-like FMN-containing flavoprotein (pyridoxamine 5'-phosphate oxidase superfamily)